MGIRWLNFIPARSITIGSADQFCLIAAPVYASIANLRGPTVSPSTALAAATNSTADSIFRELMFMVFVRR